MSVFNDIALERRRQDSKWGEQNHPNGTGPYRTLFGLNYPVSAKYFRDLRDRAIYTTDKNASCSGALSYADILLEEVFEAMAESDPQKLREELIQCAAVAVAWVQKIDRDEAKKAQ